MNAKTLFARFRDDENGSGFIGAFVVLFAVLTLGGVGVLVDSARIVSAERQASAAAFEAARSGAQAIAVPARRDGTVSLDADSARTAALDAADRLIAGTGATVSSVTVTGDEIVVTITRRVDPWFPLISGKTITVTGRARVLAGISEEGQ